MTSPTLLKEQTKQLASFLDQLQCFDDLDQKQTLLENHEWVKDFLESDHTLATKYPQLSQIKKIAAASIVFIGQAPIVFFTPKNLKEKEQRLEKLLDQLTLFEEFYQEIGGIVGYQYHILELIFQSQHTTDLSQNKKIHQAQGLNIHEEHQKADQSVIDGIKSLPLMGELYPIGGAGDRLDLRDEKTGLPLPTAKLNYLGHSLLTWMVRDLQAREYLYYKLFDKQLTTPIAMMTSEAKNNHNFIEEICAGNNWYGRDQKSFKLFKQPLAPVVTVEGNWSMSEPLSLFLKPSGHGVIWKLARDEKVLDWFFSKDRSKALLRQMNNPMAGTDHGILALLGIGCKENKAFGFASCQRLVNVSEGVNVLTETESKDGYEYAISNIEYTEFKKYNLKDVPNSPNSPYSVFPSNTNILFIDFKEVKQALERCCIPGMLINMKSNVPYQDSEGNTLQVPGGRLESTMQNIADYMTNSFSQLQEVEEPLELKTFLTYNIRRKTISVAKKTYQDDGEINETPLGCYYTLLQNNFELMGLHCNVEMPALCSTSEFVEKGPTAHILFHPALGPLYSIIGQKVQKGTVKEGSELVLEISELEVFNLKLDGSLIIKANFPMGHLRADKTLEYSNFSGRCSLINVSVENKGIDFEKENLFWQNKVHHQQKLQINLGHNSEFHAQDVHFVGDYEINVPDNVRMVATMDSQNKVTFTQHLIERPTWHWQYKVSGQNQVILTKKKTPSS